MELVLSVRTLDYVVKRRGRTRVDEGGRGDMRVWEVVTAENNLVGGWDRGRVSMTRGAWAGVSEIAYSRELESGPRVGDIIQGVVQGVVQGVIHGRRLRVCSPIRRIVLARA